MNGEVIKQNRGDLQNLLFHKAFMHDDSEEWVTFIHGAGGSSSIWFRQLRAFRKYFNVLLIDLRGHGGSKNMGDIAGNKYTFRAITNEILQVLNHRNIGSSHFVGISLGTILIQTLAEMEPERVKSMILGGAILRLNFKSRFLVGTGNIFKRVVPFFWLYKLFAWIIMPKKRHKKARLLFINDARNLCNQEFLKWYKLTFRLNAFVNSLNENSHRIPTLYLMGEEDHMFIAPVEAAVTHNKTATMEIIKESGHVCNVDQPEEFNRLAIGFINA